MGFYADHVFPHLMDWTLGTRRFQELREQALASAQGHVLEIGFGTGLNLPHYPHKVTSLTALDPATLLPRKAARRISRGSLPVELVRLSAETLPFEDGRFDCAVSTWTLCTIPNPVAALREVRRVLKPGGTYVFLEHGRSDDAWVAKWQDFFHPPERVIACGCNLNRPVDALINRGGLEIGPLGRVFPSRGPRVAGQMYRGL